MTARFTASKEAYPVALRCGRLRSPSPYCEDNGYGDREGKKEDTEEGDGDGDDVIIVVFDVGRGAREDDGEDDGSVVVGEMLMYVYGIKAHVPSKEPTREQ